MVWQVVVDEDDAEKEVWYEVEYDGINSYISKSDSYYGEYSNFEDAKDALIDYIKDHVNEWQEALRNAEYLEEKDVT